MADPAIRTFHVTSHDPDYPVYTDEQIIECAQEQPELEALHRWSMVLHNQYRYNRAQTRLSELGQIADDDFVVIFTPRDREVARFIRQVAQGQPDGARPQPARARRPARPSPPVEVRKIFRLMPRIEALAAVKGELSCANDDIVRNAAFNWSPMTAEEIRE